jgi:hypothetical protein
MQAAPSQVPTTPEALPECTTEADLRKLLTIWANAWAKEKGSRRAWVEYTQAGIARRLHRRFRSASHFQCEGLSLINPTYTNITIEAPLDASPEAIIIGKHEEINPTASARELRQEITENWTKRRSVSNTYTTTLNLGLELSGGYPGIAALKASINESFASAKGETLEFIGNRTVLVARTFTCEPGMITTIKTKSIVREANSKVRCKAQLTGKVAICCKAKVEHTGVEGHLDRGRKWAVPIRQIFQDLVRYKTLANDRIITAPEKTFIAKCLQPSIFACEDGGEGVSFYYETKITETTSLSGGSETSQQPIPGYVAPISSAPAPAPNSTGSRPTLTILSGGAVGGRGALVARAPGVAAPPIDNALQTAERIAGQGLYNVSLIHNQADAANGFAMNLDGYLASEAASVIQNFQAPATSAAGAGLGVSAPIPGGTSPAK